MKKEETMDKKPMPAKKKAAKKRAPKKAKPQVEVTTLSQAEMDAAMDEVMAAKKKTPKKRAPKKAAEPVMEFAEEPVMEKAAPMLEKPETCKPCIASTIAIVVVLAFLGCGAIAGLMMMMG